ncbi:MAG: hypothetical protein IPM07_29135 [Anaerolineales bacterium]|nr:hypothetical protein [Anaerolineales bacterium]
MRQALVLLVLAASVWMTAGCGRSASAEESVVGEQAPGRYVDRTDMAAVDRPAAPWKAPVFHQVDAKPVLPSRLVIPTIKADMSVVELGWSAKQDAAGRSSANGMWLIMRLGGIKTVHCLAKRATLC